MSGFSSSIKMEETLKLESLKFWHDQLGVEISF